MKTAEKLRHEEEIEKYKAKVFALSTTLVVYMATSFIYLLNH